MKKTRANKNTPNKPKGSRKIEKIYYVVIGLLIVILGGLVIFIFSNRGDIVTEGDQDSSPETEIVTDTEEEETDSADPESDQAAEDETEESDQEAADQDEDTESEVTEEEPEAEEEAVTEEEPETEEEAVTEEEPEDTEDAPAEEETSEADINTDAPLDESHTMNFNDGSSDRIAVDQNASAVTGINQNDMTTWWVGNNGLGRAFTVVSDSGRNNVYRVDLQYGEGEWHVTGVEELDGVPAEYR